MIITPRKHKPTFEEHTFCKREPKGVAHKVTWGCSQNLGGNTLVHKTLGHVCNACAGSDSTCLNTWVRRNPHECMGAPQSAGMAERGARKGEGRKEMGHSLVVHVCRNPNECMTSKFCLVKLLCLVSDSSNFCSCVQPPTSEA